MHAWSSVEWGEDNKGLVASIEGQSFRRHHQIARKCPFAYNMVGQTCVPYIGEKTGNLQLVIDAFVAQRRYMDAFYADIVLFSGDDNFEWVHWVLQACLVGVLGFIFASVLHLARRTDVVRKVTAACLLIRQVLPPHVSGAAC